MTKEDLIRAYHNTRTKRAYWTTIEEVELLKKIAEEEQPDIILESGTAFGWSSSWFSLTGIPIITFDPHKRLYVWEENGWEQPREIILEQGKFEEVVDRYPNLTGKKLIFIDGDHNPEGVRSDTEAVKKIAEDGDIIVWHDLNMPSVQRFWHRMQKYASKHEVYDIGRIIGKAVWKSR
jgi:predicted O-methyltransferase YrrM